MNAATRRYYHGAPRQRVFSPPFATVTAAVDVVTETIGTQSVTYAEVQELVQLLRAGIQGTTPQQELAEQVEQSTKFGALNAVIRDNPHWVAVLSVLVAVLMGIYNHNPPEAPPPAPTVVIAPPDRAEIDRIVEEKWHELETEEKQRELETHVPAVTKPEHGGAQ